MSSLTTLLLLLLATTVATAHHLPEHKAFVAGEVGRAKTVMCDTKAQAQSLLFVQKHQGMPAAQALLVKYAAMRNALGESVCAYKLYRFIAHEQVFEDRINGVIWYIVKVGVPQRGGKVLVYYILSSWPVEQGGVQPMGGCAVDCVAV